ncbi:uncharacterized protein A1O9_12201 [Exophiala aquamarina CBS 119918]|uniref:Ubiquitin-like protease family profile domain-containing protein n=1 Tax=Exophiala aquamarina CBS 119918 TaxID=1182545 RepID=A0A072NXW8_9EURO|nr:uncharacterized protein A1O9_12201 [Exophiala aquamarina CBS 119918]KEF51863.1 hypothetical protein A1O9_12201 [Exophiala aquamarina CBS 119918]
MRPKWTEALIDGFQSVISTWNAANSDPPSRSGSKSRSGPAGQQQNNHKPPLAVSHASSSTGSRAQMPSNRSARQGKHTPIKDFLSLHDNAECDPIAIDSDEEDSHSHHTSRKPSPQLPYQARPRTCRTRSESREESKLLRTLSHREPDATAIQDPMKNPAFLGGHRPVNTLNRPPTSSRSAFFQDKTTPRRGTRQHQPLNGSKLNDEPRANDHTIPNKKFKSAHPTWPGTASASAFNSNNGHYIDDSADELGLSPPSNDGTRTIAQSQRHQVQGPRNGAVTGRQRVVSLEVPNYVSPSPEHEDDFTKNSARQRKAEKDDILGNSSPNSREEHSTQTVSPYFARSEAISSLRRKIQKQDEQRILVDESVDNLKPNYHTSVNTPKKELEGHEILDKLIHGNTKSTNISKPAKRRHNKNRSSQYSFCLKEVVFSSLDNSGAYIVQVDFESEKFCINLEDCLLSEEPVLTPFSINKIVQLRYDNESLVNIRFSRSDDLQKSLYLRFSSKDSATAFINLLREITSAFNLQIRHQQWMETALARAKDALANSYVHLEKEGTKSDSVAPSQLPSPKMSTTGKRQRLVDRLDAPTANFRTQTIVSGVERGSGAQPDITVEIARTRDGVSLPHAVPHKPLESVQQSDPQQRTRRSQNHEQKEKLKVLEAEETTKIPLSATGALGPPWSRDLVYPKPGKRSATVPFEDLSRLDDDEFLNDNLISFFMQYLETYMETTRPELYKRTYFFNSYFFERLTKNVKGRGINFEAVERWTKSINIFNRDFVVVPVNENLHWYLAIVCNLQNLVPPQDEDGDPTEVRPNPKPEMQSCDEATGHLPHVRSDLGMELEYHPKAPAEETQHSLAGLTISDNEFSVTEMAPSYPKKGSTKRKQIRRSLPKIPLDKPVIITLDSLGASRSSTCSILKSYILAEGKAKRNLDIEMSAIQGMTAKGIPTQRNFSDCGLYLCMYLEQFVANPNEFVARILQREESAQSWPSEIRSEDLRSRLRDLILEVHRRQEKQQSDYELPEVGSIMIPRRDHLPESEADRRQIMKQDVEQARQRFVGLRQAHQRTSEVLTCEDLPDRQSRSKDQSAKQDFVQNDNTDLGRRRPHSPTLIQRSQGQHMVNDRDDEYEVNNAYLEIPDLTPSINESTTAGPLHNTPGELVAALHHQDEELESNKRRGLSENSTHKRSDSASTDFLSGIDSWAHHASPSASPRDAKSKKPRNQEADVVEIEAIPEPQLPPDGGLTLPKKRIARKRKRHESQKISDLEPLGHLGPSKPQESEHVQREVHGDMEFRQSLKHQGEMQRLLELGAMQEHVRIPSQHQAPREVYNGPREIEKDTGGEDSDDSMLLQ